MWEDFRIGLNQKLQTGLLKCTFILCQCGGGGGFWNISNIAVSLVMAVNKAALNS